MSNHDPHAETWDCLGCGQPWPCMTRRQELVGSFGDAISGLHLWMTSSLVMAMVYLPDVRAGDLHARFLGWLPAARRIPSPGPRPPLAHERAA